MTDFFSAISNFGFPVVVAAYLLFRFESKIDALTKINADLTAALGKQSENLTGAIQNNTQATANLSKAVKDMCKKMRKQ